MNLKDDVLILGKISDWFDLQVEENDKFLTELLINGQLVRRKKNLDFSSVQSVRLADPPSLWKVAVYVLAMTPQRFAQAYVGTFRIGRGVATKTWRGAGEDALRLLNVVPLPVGKLLAYLGILEVTQEAGKQTCAFVSTINALRQTGYLQKEYFVGIKALAKAVGRSWEAIETEGTTAAQFNAIIDVLKKIGIACEEIRPLSPSFKDLEDILKAKPPGVVLVSIQWIEKGVSNGHRIYASLTSAGGVVYQDTNGGIPYRSVKELVKAFPEVRVNQQFSLLFIRNATLIQSSIFLPGGLAEFFLRGVPVPSDETTNAPGQVGPPKAVPGP